MTLSSGFMNAALRAEAAAILRYTSALSRWQ